MSRLFLLASCELLSSGHRIPVSLRRFSKERSAAVRFDFF